MRFVPSCIIAVLLGMATAVIMSCSTGRPSGGNLTTVELSAMEAIEGTATYQERIALPPNSVFEAVLLKDKAGTRIALFEAVHLSG